MQPLGKRTWGLLIAFGAILLAGAGYKLVKWGFSAKPKPMAVSIPKAAEENFESLMAKELYERALSLNPTSAEAHNNLGYQLLEKGQFIDSERHLKQAVDLDPSCSECLNNLGILKTKQGQFTQAEGYLKQAIIINEKKPESYYNLGVLYEKNGDTGNAIYFYESYLRHSADKETPDYLQVENRILKLKGGQ
jgi:Tfp pilus assembly protein PilF